MIYNITAQMLNVLLLFCCFLSISSLLLMATYADFLLFLVENFPLINARTAALITGHQISYGMTLDN